jgi:TetR/AcrR family transcriptional regulator, mexJK operon transcriptional repressor
MSAAQQPGSQAPSRGNAAGRSPAPLGRRGRPSRGEGERLNRAIVDAARMLFLENGYAVTSMDAVAMRAGISKGTLYNRFGSKAELFAAIVRDRVAEWGRHDAVSTRPPVGDIEALLEHHVTTTLNSLADPEIAAFVALITAERNRFPELARIYYDMALSVEVERLKADIEAAAEAEGLAVRDVDSVAYTLLQAALGWWNMQILAGPPPAAGVRTAAARRIAQLFAQGRAGW